MAKLATVGALSLSGLAWFAVAGQVFVAQFFKLLARNSLAQSPVGFAALDQVCAATVGC